MTLNGSSRALRPATPTLRRLHLFRRGTPVGAGGWSLEVKLDLFGVQQAARAKPGHRLGMADTRKRKAAFRSAKLAEL